MTSSFPLIQEKEFKGRVTSNGLFGTSLNAPVAAIFHGERMSLAIEVIFVPAGWLAKYNLSIFNDGSRPSTSSEPFFLIADSKPSKDESMIDAAKRALDFVAASSRPDANEVRDEIGEAIGIILKPMVKPMVKAGDDESFEDFLKASASIPDDSGANQEKKNKMDVTSASTVGTPALTFEPETKPEKKTIRQSGRKKGSEKK
jgi:hypothetical protein